MWKSAAAATVGCGLLAVVAISALSTPGRERSPAAVTAGKHYAYRGMYDRDLSRTGFDDQAAIGFNLIDSGPARYQMRPLAAHGLKGLIWLGGYDNETCTFRENDDWVRSHVRAVRGSGAAPGTVCAAGRASAPT